MKIEFLCHRDTNAVAAPCVLNYWRSSHTAGRPSMSPKASTGRSHRPFLIYVNSGADPQTLWKDALAQVDRESSKCPTTGQERGLSHEGTARHSQGPAGLDRSRGAECENVARSHWPRSSAYLAVAARLGTAARQVDWQTDAKHYDSGPPDNGRFEFLSSSGTYTLHAIADGCW